jgi:hypothetical protein
MAMIKEGIAIDMVHNVRDLREVIYAATRNIKHGWSIGASKSNYSVISNA